MRKRFLSLLLVLIMVIGAFPAVTLASDPIEVSFSYFEGFVYEGGIFDVKVHVEGTNADKATYRWQADASYGKGHYYDLKDNSSWRGTHTEHLQLYTHEGILYGTGWEDIPFRCPPN